VQAGPQKATLTDYAQAVRVVEETEGRGHGRVPAVQVILDLDALIRGT
jgi:hypothetical protein